MAFLSAPIGREFVFWRVLLLIVSLLTSWSLPTTAQVAIVSTTAAKGSDAFLRVHNKPTNATGFIWYKGKGANPMNNIVELEMDTGEIIEGPAFSGRETIGSEGSLWIKNVTLDDIGNYTVVVTLQGGMKEIGFGHLLVYEPVTFAYLIASDTTVTFNEDALVMTCYTDGDSVRWYFKDMDLILTERMKLSEDGRSLTIDPIKAEDSGMYHCEGANAISYVKSWYVKLTENSD